MLMDDRSLRDANKPKPIQMELIKQLPNLRDGAMYVLFRVTCLIRPFQN